MVKSKEKKPLSLTNQIIIALFLGALVGLIIRYIPLPDKVRLFILDDILQVGGTIFIDLMKMLVVPVVFVSLVYGCSSLESVGKLGRIGLKTFFLYLLTTVLAITVALCISSMFSIGKGINIDLPVSFNPSPAPSIKQVIIDLVPRNPIQSMAEGNMLQLIVFALFFGTAILMSGTYGVKVKDLFFNINHVLMNLVNIVMKLSPYGIFCLLAHLFAKQGFEVLALLAQYFVMVLLVLAIQLFVIYSLIIRFIGGLSPAIFFRKLYPAMLFAFGVSSSNASIPVVLETVEKRLGVKEQVASFVIPLGATINMDGTSIMQGVATVFIAHIFNIDIGFTGYLTVIAMATLASIGTAGVPSVGLITLGMVLQQVGIPLEGIAFILGIDRLLDMARTVVNISGDAMISCLVAKSENLFSEDIFTAKESDFPGEIVTK